MSVLALALNWFIDLICSFVSQEERTEEGN